MTTSITLDQAELQVVPLALIDPPDVAMRETMSDEGLESLATSIRAVGLLQNLVLVRNGERFRVAAGHRRSLALAMAGKTDAHALVFPEGTPLEEAAKVAENTEREDVNPAAEATYYLHVYNGPAQKDVERVATIVNRKVSHVLDRLDLTRGDDAVLDALRPPKSRKPDSPMAAVFPEHDIMRLGTITLAVAKELNKVKEDNYRRLFLHDALLQGANSKTVQRWRQDRDQARRYQEAVDAGDAAPVAPSSEAPIQSLDQCPFCYSAKDQHDMTYVRVHRSCLSVFGRQQAQGEGGS